MKQRGFPPPIPRLSGRVIVLDAADRILLFRGTASATAWAGRETWLLPGGGALAVAAQLFGAAEATRASEDLARRRMRHAWRDGLRRRPGGRYALNARRPPRANADPGGGGDHPDRRYCPAYAVKTTKR